LFPTHPFLWSTSAMTNPFSATTSRADERTSRARARGTANFVNLRALAALLLGLCAAAPSLADTLLLRPARVFDGVNPQPHEGWSVLVEGDRIAAVGPDLSAPAGARTIDLPGTTLMPGMIEGHSHLFLHPYNETLWDDQVLHEP